MRYACGRYWQFRGLERTIREAKIRARLYCDGRDVMDRAYVRPT